MREALEKYCSASHPDVKVSSVPFPAISLFALLTRNDELKFFIGLMKHFERFGEYGDPAESERLLGKPATNIERWCR